MMATRRGPSLPGGLVAEKALLLDETGDHCCGEIDETGDPCARGGRGLGIRLKVARGPRTGRRGAEDSRLARHESGVAKRNMITDGQNGKSIFKIDFLSRTKC